VPPAEPTELTVAVALPSPPPSLALPQPGLEVSTGGVEGSGDNDEDKGAAVAVTEEKWGLSTSPATPAPHFPRKIVGPNLFSVSRARGISLDPNGAHTYAGSTAAGFDGLWSSAADGWGIVARGMGVLGAAAAQGVPLPASPLAAPALSASAPAGSLILRLPAQPSEEASQAAEHSRSQRRLACATATRVHADEPDAHVRTCLPPFPATATGLAPALGPSSGTGRGHDFTIEAPTAEAAAMAEARRRQRRQRRQQSRGTLWQESGQDEEFLRRKASKTILGVEISGTSCTGNTLLRS
jgi:hypothetical protein